MKIKTPVRASHPRPRDMKGKAELGGQERLCWTEGA